VVSFFQVFRSNITFKISRKLLLGWEYLDSLPAFKLDGHHLSVVRVYLQLASIPRGPLPHTHHEAQYCLDERVPN